MVNAKNLFLFNVLIIKYCPLWLWISCHDTISGINNRCLTVDFVFTDIIHIKSCQDNKTESRKVHVLANGVSLHDAAWAFSLVYV